MTDDKRHNGRPYGQVVNLIDGTRLLEDVRAFILRYVVLPSDEAADFVALWVLHTHAFEAAWATPYLRITSAAPESGKTLLMEILAALTRGGWHAVNPSPAVLYRKVDRDTPTLLIDEMDNYRLDERRDALAILNGGYKRGAKVPRCNEKGELLEFSAFCPKAYAGIDNRQMPDTMLSRSVTIRLERRLTTERVEMWLAPLNEPEAIGLRARCEQWADSAVVDALAVARPNLPAGLFNRGAEIWWPLLAIADCAGAEWPARARSAARVLYVGGDDRDNQSDEVRLLADLRAAFGDEHTISTEALLAALNGFEESPWGARRRGDGLDARGLAKMLRPYKTVEGIPIRPKPVRVGSKTPRGYHVDQFEDAFARYLPEAQHPQQAQHPAPRLEPDVADVADSPGWSTEEAEREIERLREKFGEAA